ncbi:unnamed protein product [Adineta ricciae]|uniref:CCHC-type domain-containing protein n=1 Tax=Adineta ricciae TaxID=249248 RepID=A0A814LVI6_ADIRI|nr:unnamed protein product [Adineta ricciae]CAF1360636.1 unnamed protein product [Adineta ricciae]
MVDQTLLARARKARYDDLPNFSGHPSEDAERFLKSIKNITKANNDPADPMFLEIVRGKLTQNAGLWFDDNESQFNRWSDFETTFRNRYFSTTNVNTKFDKLSQRKQQPDESVTAYYDDIITLCREVDPNMTDAIIIQHLMKGINPEFRKELTRRQTAIATLPEFLRIAKLEQDLHDVFTQSQEVMTQPEAYPMYHLGSANNRNIPRKIPGYGQQLRNLWSQNSRSTPMKNSDQNRNSYSKIPQITSIRKQTSNSTTETGLDQNNQTPHQSCKVCGKQNHRSIDCFKKRQSGCFNCGQGHPVRNCPDPPHFQ